MAKKAEDALPLRDIFLESMIKTVNYQQMEIELTLQCDGFLISGKLIGIRQYYDELVKKFPDSDLIKGISEFKERLASDERMKADQLKDTKFHFFHMKDAKFYTTSSLPVPANGTVWRGKIDNITGFSYGELGPPIM